MGSLKPGASYIYENSDGVVYAREVGADPSTRKIVGYESAKAYQRALGFEESNLWNDILKTSKTNETLHEAMERVKVLYYLIKNGDSKT